ncbi:MAG: RNA-binding protein [Halobacteriovoraceae bacterium]|jgi:RNA recognition motif-containing protein|nr:RNA-binding protein [Halobacteriovoraceae bacterium]
MSLTKIYVGNLKYTKSELDIKKMFKVYGKVGRANIVIDRKTEKSKGIAFVQMFNQQDAINAIKELNGKEVDGRTLKVSVALEREGLEKQSTSKPKLSAKEQEEKKAKPKRKPKGLKVLLNYLGN